MDARLVSSPEEAPAVDYLTGSAVGPFVDTGVYAKDELGRRLGRIYLSADTVRALASLVDPPKNTQSEDYAKGFFDGTKEAVGGNLADIARDIRRYLDIIAPTDSAGDPA